MKTIEILINNKFYIFVEFNDNNFPINFVDKLILMESDEYCPIQIPQLCDYEENIDSIFEDEFRTRFIESKDFDKGILIKENVNFEHIKILSFHNKIFKENRRFTYKSFDDELHGSVFSDFCRIKYLKHFPAYIQFRIWLNPKEYLSSFANDFECSTFRSIFYDRINKIDNVIFSIKQKIKNGLEQYVQNIYDSFNKNTHDTIFAIFHNKKIITYSNPIKIKIINTNQEEYELK